MSLGDILDPHAESIPILKLGLHGLQILFAFVAWCLEVTVFRSDGAAINSNSGWAFAVGFLSVPAWIYLILTPRYSRSAKFASPRLMLAVDGVFTFIWLSAFASQAAYNTSNSCGSACNLSEAAVGLGVFVFLFFCATTFLSAYTVKYNDWNGHLPGYGSVHTGRTHAAAISSVADPSDPDKAAFSMAPHGEDAYAPLGGGGGGGVVDDDDLNEPYDSIPHLGHGADPYGSVASRTSYGGLSTAASAAAAAENPFRRQELQSNPFDPEGSEYLGAGGVAHYGQPAAAQFPPANYDRIGLERPRMG